MEKKINQTVIDAIEKIIERGNTCEIKQGKHGLMVSEIKRKILINPPSQQR